MWIVEVLDKNSPPRALEGLISTKADKLSALVAFVETKERQCSGEYPQGTLSSSLASGIWDFSQVRWAGAGDMWLDSGLTG
ncbi:hypothetical protein DPV78_008820 [Talaromyces pinophilus]|nr:hypothetical protein DPV78_008820 [Talaromyces pinophilus]